MSEAILFDRDKVERLDDIADRPKRLSGSKLLWVDVDRESEESANRVAEAFGLDRQTRDCLASSKDRAIFHDRGRYVHVTTYAPDQDDEGQLIALESSSARTGFLAALLEWVLGSYSAAFERIEERLEEFDIEWAVLAVIVAIAPITIAIAKRQNWI